MKSTEEKERKKGMECFREEEYYFEEQWLVLKVTNMFSCTNLCSSCMDFNKADLIDSTDLQIRQQSMERCMLSRPKRGRKK